MRRQTLELPVSHVADTPPDGKSADVLVRLWEEAKQTIAIQRPPNLTLRQADQAERATKVRYAYD